VSFTARTIDRQTARRSRHAEDDDLRSGVRRRRRRRYSPISVQPDRRVGHDFQDESDGRPLVAVDAEQAGLLAALPHPRDDHQVADAGRMDALQLDGLPKIHNKRQKRENNNHRVESFVPEVKRQTQDECGTHETDSFSFRR
jgi:hypothetical protein